jgi:hypothetical protein
MAGEDLNSLVWEAERLETKKKFGAREETFRFQTWLKGFPFFSPFV